MGAPLAHTLESFSAEAWRQLSTIKLISKGDVKVLQGTVTNVDMGHKKVHYFSRSSQDPKREVEYDYLVVATGMRRAFPIVPKALGKEEYLQDAIGNIEELTSSEKIVIVGGGR